MRVNASRYAIGSRKIPRKKNSVSCETIVLTGETTSEKFPGSLRRIGDAEFKGFYHVIGQVYAEFRRALDVYGYGVLFKEILLEGEAGGEGVVGFYLLYAPLHALFFALRMLTYDEAARTVGNRNLSVVLGEGCVVTFQDGVDGDPLKPVRERIRSVKGRIRGEGADYLAYAVMDSVVDEYFGVLEKLGDHIEDLDDRILSAPDATHMKDLHLLKREMLFLRKAVWPLREEISALEKSDSRSENGSGSEGRGPFNFPAPLPLRRGIKKAGSFSRRPFFPTSPGILLPRTPTQ